MKVKERDKQITTKCLNKQKRERKGGKKNNTKIVKASVRSLDGCAQKIEKRIGVNNNQSVLW